MGQRSVNPSHGSGLWIDGVGLLDRNVDLQLIMLVVELHSQKAIMVLFEVSQYGIPLLLGLGLKHHSRGRDDGSSNLDRMIRLFGSGLFSGDILLGSLGSDQLLQRFIQFGPPLQGDLHVAHPLGRKEIAEDLVHDSVLASSIQAIDDLNHAFDLVRLNQALGDQTLDEVSGSKWQILDRVDLGDDHGTDHGLVFGNGRLGRDRRFRNSW